MQKRKPSKNEHTAPKTRGLQQEAADMEAKLLELRKAMEIERARRETIMSAATNGALWRNGATGLLRSNFRSKVASASSANQQAPTSSSASQPSISGRIASAPSVRAEETANMAGSCAKIQGGRSTYDAEVARRPKEDLRAKMKSPGPIGLDGQGLSATAISSLAPQRRKPEVMTIHDQGGRAVDGMGCGGDGPDGLAAGAFSEADSHKSFLDALNEWRNGSSGNAAAGPTKVDGGNAAGAGTEAQTETSSSKPPRPMSAQSKKTYFQKLALNSASREAGGCAAGAASSTSASRVQLASGRAPDIAGPAPLPAHPSSVEGRFAMLERLEQLERQQEEREDPDSDKDGEGDDIVVTTQQGILGLVKGVRLPDAIMVPEYEEDS